MSLVFCVGATVSLVALILVIKFLSMSLIGFAFIALLPVIGFTYGFCRKRPLSDSMKWASVIIQLTIAGLCFVGIVMVDPIFADHHLTVVDTEGAQKYIVETAVLSAQSLDPRRSLELLTKNANFMRTYDPSVRQTRKNGVSIFQENRLNDIFGSLPKVYHPELANRTLTQTIGAYRSIFEELPVDGFDPAFKNPCWFGSSETESGSSSSDMLQCLPYVYLLGQPKSGTTDLYLHLSKHPDFVNPRRKEVRFFTRGEFTDPPALEDIIPYGDADRVKGEGSRKLLGYHSRRDKEALESGSIPKHGHVDAGKGGRKAQQRLKPSVKAKRPLMREKEWLEPKRKGKAARIHGLEEGGKEEAGQLITRAHGDAEEPWALRFTPENELRGGQTLLDENTPLVQFTEAFGQIANRLMKAGAEDRSRLIALDGGPHTLWWPLQKPDGTYTRGHDISHSTDNDLSGGNYHPLYAQVADVNIPQLLAAIQPAARFLVTVSDPVNRLYSDYNFLGDDLKPVKHNKKTGRSRGSNNEGGERESEKSPEEFHTRAVAQVEQMRACIEAHMRLLPESRRAETVEHTNQREHVHGMGWFRASQICAHDRVRFGRGGWGRLSIGMYSVFVEKWLEHFYSDQFLVVKLEEMDRDPRAYFSRIFTFLGVGIPENDEEWDQIIGGNSKGEHHANAHHGQRRDMLPETRALLEEFYQPYNAYLARLLGDDNFLWGLGPDIAPEHGGAGLLDRSRLSGSGLRGGATRPVIRGSSASGGMSSVMRGLDVGKTWFAKNVGGLTNYPEAGLHHPGAPPPPPDELPVQPEIVTTVKESKMDKSGQIVHGESGGDVETEATFTVTAKNLCNVIIDMNATRLQSLLDSGPLGKNMVLDPDSGRTPLFCLVGLYLLADASSKSLVFSILKGKDLGHDAPFYSPPLPSQANSIDSKTILLSLSGTLRSLGDVLFAKDAFRDTIDVNQRDQGGNTALHVAAAGGVSSMVALLLEQGADPMITNVDARLPLHFAVALGNAEIAAALLATGRSDAQFAAKDESGVSPMDILMMPGGPVVGSDFAKWFPKLPARRAIRQIAPLPEPAAEEGGWSTERLEGHPRSADSCDVDMYYAHEITPDEVFRMYTSRLTPVLIRGLLKTNDDMWPPYEHYTREALMEVNGKMKVTASSIPYADKFGGEGETMTLGEYIDSVHENRMLGGTHPYCKSALKTC